MKINVFNYISIKYKPQINLKDGMCRSDPISKRMDFYRIDTLSALFWNHALVPCNISNFHDGTAYNTSSIESNGKIAGVLKNIVKAPL